MTNCYEYETSDKFIYYNGNTYDKKDVRRLKDILIMEDERKEKTTGGTTLEEEEENSETFDNSTNVFIPSSHSLKNNQVSFSFKDKNVSFSLECSSGDFKEFLTTISNILINKVNN